MLTLLPSCFLHASHHSLSTTVFLGMILWGMITIHRYVCTTDIPPMCIPPLSQIPQYIGTMGCDFCKCYSSWTLGACAARVIVLGLCVCLSVCLSVCVSVCYSTSHYSSDYSCHKRTHLFSGGWRSKHLSDFLWKWFIAELEYFLLEYTYRPIFTLPACVGNCSAICSHFRDIFCELSIGSNYVCKKGMPAVQSCCTCEAEDVWRVHGCRLYTCVYIAVTCV